MFSLRMDQNASREDATQAVPTSAILVVEDEAIVALDIQSQLQGMGYEVLGPVDNGADALRLAAERPPSLVLMDIRIKGEMDGIETAMRMRAPTIFLTSFSDAETVRRAAETAPYGYLNKPFQTKELRASIEVAIYKARVEKSLRESERWFSSTLRCVQDGVIVTGTDQRIKFLNPAAEALTGWRREEAVARPLAEVVSMVGGQAGGVDVLDAPKASCLVQALRDGRAVGVWYGQTLASRQGERIPVDESAAPVFDDTGVLLGGVLVLRDDRVRLQMEGELRACEEQFRSAFDAAPLGMALISVEGHFLQVNQALCQLLGCDAAWLQSQNHDAVTWPEDQAHERAQLNGLLAEDAEVAHFEKRYIRPLQGGGPVWTHVSASLLRRSHQPVCYLYQIHDLTAQKEAAEQLAKIADERLRMEASAIANRAQSQFLSRLSHEMRTPLNAVIGFAQLMQMGGEQQAAGNAKEYSEHILKAGQHLLALVDDVLDLQRVAQGKLNLKMGAVHVGTAMRVVSDFLKPMAEAHGARLSILGDVNLLVMADDMRFRQVLLNIGSNAIKYNRPGGTVIWNAARLDDGKVCLTVTDQGAGMSADQLARLFSPFERLGRESSSIPGHGLGLMISRALTGSMGGTLDIQSEEGVGTTVALTLPSA